MNRRKQKTREKKGRKIKEMEQKKKVILRPAH